MPIFKKRKKPFDLGRDDHLLDALRYLSSSSGPILSSLIEPPLSFKPGKIIGVNASSANTMAFSSSFASPFGGSSSYPYGSGYSPPEYRKPTPEEIMKLTAIRIEKLRAKKKTEEEIETIVKDYVEDIADEEMSFEGDTVISVSGGFAKLGSKNR